MINNMLIKAINKSQHCQRNWDLSKQIPEEDMKVLESCVTECPSKQNIPFYKPIFITNRDLIEKIHELTEGFIRPGETKIQTNSQTLANLLVVFVSDYQYVKEVVMSGEEEKEKRESNDSIDQLFRIKKESGALQDNRKISVGIAAGYLNIVGTILGLETGCCSCMNGAEVKKELQKHVDLDDVIINDGKGNTVTFSPHVMLLMGIGYKDNDRNRREHHNDACYLFPTIKKDMDVVHID